MLKKPITNLVGKFNKCLIKMTAPYVKLKTPLNDLSVVCRGCLADSGEMKNIREWGLLDDFLKYTGIQLRISDGISELICTACEETLIKCKLFEQQCKKSDMSLRNFIMSEKQNSPIMENENKITFTFNENKLIFTITAPQPNESLNFPCPYNCKETYTKKNDLLNHLIRTHMHNRDYNIEYHYHCSKSNCSYNQTSQKQKYFLERKYLNQHYNKVHKTKIYHCDVCEKNFATITEHTHHRRTCNMVFDCQDCNKTYINRERLLVHLARRHPDKHKQYKEAKKAEKRKSKTEIVTKKAKVESFFETDSPKRSFATQTLNPQYTVKNDVTLPSWRQTDETSTQTGFEDILSLKSNSEDSLFYSETALSDIQTQTFPLEFGLVDRLNKETLTESLDLSMKGTQTCFCHHDSMIAGFEDTVRSLTSTETQTKTSDDFMSLNSIETQTCFDEAFKDSL